MIKIYTIYTRLTCQYSHEHVKQMCIINTIAVNNLGSFIDFLFGYQNLRNDVQPLGRSFLFVGLHYSW